MFMIINILMVFLVGCTATAPDGVVPTPTPVVIPSPSPTPVATPTPVPQPIPESFPVKGWVPVYDILIKEQALTKYPALLNLEAKRLNSFCPKWASLDQTQRQTFYADLLYAIAGPESAWDRSSMYYEKGFSSPDAITGLPVVSEGFLQLSYQDGKWYKGCEMDWAKDREYFLEDWQARGEKTSWKSKHADQRTILDGRINLSCGLFIINMLLTKEAYKNEAFETTLGKYWSTMRTSSGSHAKVRTNMQARKSPCY